MPDPTSARCDWAVGMAVQQPVLRAQWPVPVDASRLADRRRQCQQFRFTNTRCRMNPVTRGLPTVSVPVLSNATWVHDPAAPAPRRL